MERVGKKGLGVLGMTRLEMEFYETMIKAMREIVKELKELNKTLKEGENNDESK